MNNPRVLLVSGGTGAGHVVAAKAIEEELRAHGVPVEHRDAYAYVSRLSRWAYTELHLRLLEYVPEFYGPLYERGSQSRLLAGLQQRLVVKSRALFAIALRDLRPDVVCVTHALGCAIAAPLKAPAGFRLAVVTTDYRAHAFHLHPAVDCYLVSSLWAAADLQAAGIPAERIVVTGIPLRSSFDALPSQAAARSALSLPPDRPVLLVSRGGMFAGSETADLLRALLAAPDLTDCVVVAILGSRERSARLVAGKVGLHPRLRVERFVPNMATYFAAADLVVGKAGGLSSTEVFTVGRPLVIYAPNEGIETANVARFVAAGVAIDAGRSPSRVVTAVAELLRDPARAAALTAAGRALVQPRSRGAVRSVLVQLAAGVPLPAPVPATARNP